MRKLIFVCSLVLLAITACKPSVPNEYLQPDELEDILYDYHLAQSMTRQGKNDSMYYRRYVSFVSILQKHQVTEAEFDSSLVYYYSHMDYLYKVYERVSERVEEENKRLGISTEPTSTYAQYKAEGDTANIWPYATNIILKPVSPYNRMDFELKVDTTFKKGDTFLFNFMADFIYQSGTKDAVLYIAMTYENDSVSTFSSHTSVSGFSQLRMVTDTLSSIKSIKGFIYLDKGTDDSNTLKLFVASHIQLIRFHSTPNALGTNADNGENAPSIFGSTSAPEPTPSGPLQITVDSSRTKKGRPIKMKDVTFR